MVKSKISHQILCLQPAAEVSPAELKRETPPAQHWGASRRAAAALPPFSKGAQVFLPSLPASLVSSTTALQPCFDQKSASASLLLHTEHYKIWEGRDCKLGERWDEITLLFPQLPLHVSFPAAFQTLSQSNAKQACLSPSPCYYSSPSPYPTASKDSSSIAAELKANCSAHSSSANQSLLTHRWLPFFLPCLCILSFGVRNSQARFYCNFLHVDLLTDHLKRKKKIRNLDDC